MLVALAERPSVPFMEMQRMLEANYGTMSQHAARLARFGYITIDKSFVGRMPRTDYSLTEAGRAALRQYLAKHAELTLNLAPPRGTW